MTEDVQRLHASGLAPSGRAALMKALELRFSVLLSPAFWRAPIAARYDDHLFASDASSDFGLGAVRCHQDATVTRLLATL